MVVTIVITTEAVVKLHRMPDGGLVIWRARLAMRSGQYGQTALTLPFAGGEGTFGNVDAAFESGSAGGYCPPRDCLSRSSAFLSRISANRRSRSASGKAARWVKVVGKRACGKQTWVSLG
jgi:hypothetical protein